MARSQKQQAYAPTKKEIDAVIAAIAEGSSVDAAAKANKVATTTFYRYLDQHPDAVDEYARARDKRNDRIAEDTLRIADDTSLEADHKRIMVDTRKWLLSKLARNKYGELTRTEITGADGGPVRLSNVLEDIPVVERPPKNPPLA